MHARVRPGLRRGGRWTAVGLLPFVAACTIDGQPRSRLGSLPYPGMFTLFALADPDELGTHRYDPWVSLADERPEAERGTLYTCRAGFVDLSHARTAIDWSWYWTRQVEPALRQGRTTLAITGWEHTRYHVTFSYPEWWAHLDPDERAGLVDELSCQIGEQLAYTLLTWHEIVTWYGYRSTGILPEHASAFTYDDMVAHVIGLRVADQAMRDGQRTFDDAVTHALEEELVRLEVVPPTHAWLAVKAVEGEWWSADGSSRRYVEIGLEEGVVEPWIVHDLLHWGRDEPQLLSLPSLDDVHGFDCRGIYDVEIESAIGEAAKIRAFLPDRPRRIHPRTHFPTIVRHIREQATGLETGRN